MTAVDDIKSRIHIEDLVNEIPTVKLRKSGKNLHRVLPISREQTHSGICSLSGFWYLALFRAMQ